MGNRSNINLVGNTTTGQNLGNGVCVFKCKSNGNNLQFRTISASGSTQIFQTDNGLVIFGTGGSGTTYTFSNGLTQNINSVELGGSLSKHTAISGGTSKNFGIVNTLNLTLSAINGMYLCGLPSKSTETCAVYIAADGKLATGTVGEGGGTITGATNGLGVTGKNICLGGTLLNTTSITGSQTLGINVTTLNLTGTTINLSDTVKLLSTPTTGADTDKILLWNSTDKQVKQIATSGITGGGFLGTVSRTSAEPTGLKNNQWVKPAPSGNCFCYTFTNFCDATATPISVNLSLEDVTLRYHSSGDYWSKESYNRPITSGRTWVGNAISNCV